MNILEKFSNLVESYNKHRHDIMISRVSSFESLIKEFEELYEKGSNLRVKQYNQLVNNFLLLQESILEDRKTTAPNFNPLKLLKVTEQELKHSDILAWLFDPFNTHSQGDIFFSHFLNYFGFNVEYNKWNYKVKREYCGKESIIDILIYGKDFIFYIENKTNSLEGWEQTPREYRDLERLAKSMGKRKKFAIFLTPTGVKPSDEKNWMIMSYPELACALEPSLTMIQSVYVRFFVESWLNILKYLGGSNEI